MRSPERCRRTCPLAAAVSAGGCWALAVQTPCLIVDGAATVVVAAVAVAAAVARRFGGMVWTTARSARAASLVFVSTRVSHATPRRLCPVGAGGERLRVSHIGGKVGHLDACPFPPEARGRAYRCCCCCCCCCCCASFPFWWLRSDPPGSPAPSSLSNCIQ